MSTSLSGLGLWIWRLKACEGGNIPAMCAKAQAAGIKWVAIKAGNDTANGQVTASTANAFRANGIEVAAWWYSRPTTTDQELALLEDLVKNQEIRHVVIDAETEWESMSQNGKVASFDWRRRAADFARSIRNVIGSDTFFADAPWFIPRAHPLFPFNEFGSIAQGRFPQAYYGVAELDGNQPQMKYLAEGDLSWASSTVPVSPIVSPVNEYGTRHAPIEELGWAVDRYAMRPSPSIWSWDSLSEQEWSLLRFKAAANAAPAT